MTNLIKVPKPPPEVVETLQWALEAAVNEYVVATDDHSHIDAAREWLNLLSYL